MLLWCSFNLSDGKTSKESLPLFTLLKQILTQRSFGNYYHFIVYKVKEISITNIIREKCWWNKIFPLIYVNSDICIYFAVCFVAMNFFQVIWMLFFEIHIPIINNQIDTIKNVQTYHIIIVFVAWDHLISI